MGWQALDPHRHGLFHLTLCQRRLSSEPDPLGMLLALRRMTFEGGRFVLLTRLGERVGFDGDGWTFDAATAESFLAAAGWQVTGAFEVDGGHAFTAGTAPVSGWLEAAQHPRSEANNRFPVGHYYSPLPDHTELAARRERIWPAVPRATPGVDWRDDTQVRLCREVFAAQERLAFPASSEDPSEYFTGNDQYPALDAWLLEALLRHLRPRRMIEVGSGFSSLVSARVNRECLDGAMTFTCIEPYPRPFLVDGVPGVSELRVEKIQDTPLSVFEALGDGDVLFVDTSHTVKTGGDVPWIFEEILPRLAPGVVVHVHDVFLPGDYPEPWVMEGWGWNEVYLVHAFLAFNAGFEVLAGAQYLLQNHRELLFEAFPGLAEQEARGGGALWLRRR
jgi:predicted O-methyltransferase YrrM